MINIKTKTKKILIVVDYQYDFVSKKGALPVEGADTIWKNIQEKINDKSYDFIIYTFDTHNKKDYYNSEESKSFPNIHCEFGTKGWWLYKIQPRSNDIKRMYHNRIIPADIVINEEFFFVKDKFSIWEGNPDYKDFFNNAFEKDIQIDICGVAEDVCVSMNGIGLKENGYTNVNVLSNCVKSIGNNETIVNISRMKEYGIKYV